MRNKLINERMSALKVFFPARKFNIILVGCGGTGSWLAPHLARMTRLLVDMGREINLRFYDDDIVKEKNLYRQNFCPADIGMQKDEVLSRRFSLAWSIPIMACGRFDGGGYGNGPSIILGCVDGAKGRNYIAQSLSRNDHSTARWWIDCGNARTSGQVLFGGGNKPDKWFTKVVPEGFITWVPRPDEQVPELLDEDPVELDAGTNLSCAEMAMQSAQGLTINQMMASIAADYLKSLVITQTLDRMSTYVSLDAGTMNSTYTAPDNLRVRRRRKSK